MTCPRCGSPVASLQAQCPKCDFSLSTVVNTFGQKLVKLERLTDAANCLRLREAQAVDTVLEELEGTFPQVFFAVYFGILPPSFSVGELSFWLLNHAAFNSNEIKKLNEYAVLLIIDPVGKCAGINVGYGLESLLPPKRLQKILQGIRTPLWHGEFVNAVTRALDAVCKILRKAGTASRPVMNVTPPETTQEFMGRSGLQSLRTTSSTHSPKEADIEWRYQKGEEPAETDDDRPYI